MRSSKVRLSRLVGIAGAMAVSVPALTLLSTEVLRDAGPHGPAALFDFKAPRDTAWVDDFHALRRDLGHQEQTGSVHVRSGGGEVADLGAPPAADPEKPRFETPETRAGMVDPVVTGAAPALAPGGQLSVKGARVLLPPVPEPHGVRTARVIDGARPVTVIHIPPEGVAPASPAPPTAGLALPGAAAPAVGTTPVGGAPLGKTDDRLVPEESTAAVPGAAPGAPGPAAEPKPSADAGMTGGLAPAPWVLIRAAAPSAPATAPATATTAERAEAPVPRPRPEPGFFRDAARQPPRGEGAPKLLGYAAPGADKEAPFRSVLAEPGSKSPDKDAPRASIGPKLPPNMHGWAYSALPASVHEAKEQKCLAEAIYFESRGEPEVGQAAVAQVVLNRVRNPAYPDRICDVVYQNDEMYGRCQFSFACDGIPEWIRDREAWTRAVTIAKDVTEGRIYSASVGDSTHYHATWVRPGWRRSMIRLTRIGVHVFYRTVGGGWI